jgi:L-fuconolactonase
MVVDSHCHASPFWYEPVDVLLHQMDRHGVERAVLVQMLGQYDNDYQEDCVARFPGRFASVVMVDPAAADACAQLRRLVDRGARGVRLRPGSRSPGADPLALWRTAADCGVAVSCVGSSSTLADAAFRDLVGALPDLAIVLEHLGGSSRPDADDAERACRSRVFDLAAFPNVYLKLPGLGELAPRTGPPSGPAFGSAAPDVLVQALAKFGPGRVLWGSDETPGSSREGYGNALQWTRDALAEQSPDSRAMMFGGVAARVFALAA